MTKILKDIILPSLVTIEDFAYVEDASGTLAMLKMLETLIRYAVDEHEEVPFAQEMKNVEAMLSLYKLRFGSLEYIIFSEKTLNDSFILKYSILGKTLEQLDIILNEAKGYVSLNVNIVREAGIIKVKVEAR